MSEKILPFIIPINACYPAISGASGILFSDPSLHDWMYNNFIQIFEVESNHALDYYDFSIENNPFLSYNELDFTFIRKNWDSISSFIISSLKDNYYVRLFVNIEKLPLYPYNQTFYHDLIVFGVNEEASIFHVADHFKNQQFVKSTCSFSELEIALDTFLLSSYDSVPGTLRCAQLIKKDTDFTKLRYSLYTKEQIKSFTSLNLDRIIKSLSDYITCTPTQNWYTRGHVMDENFSATHKWGLDCYDILRLHIQQVIDTGLPLHFAKQSFYLMYNHKVVMRERIKILSHIYPSFDMERHLNSYTKLCVLSKSLMMNFIKFTIKKDKHTNVPRLIDSVRILYNSDYEATQDLLSNLIKLQTQL